MHAKKHKVPPAFVEALSRPFPNKQVNSRTPSQVEQLHSRLAAHYRSIDSKGGSSAITLAEKQESDSHYWEQSGQVLRWIGEHVSASGQYRDRKSAIPKEKFHRQLVASKVNRLLKHEPLAYVLGTQPFGPLDIICRPPVLIPRPETEHLFEDLGRLLIETTEQHERRDAIVPPLKILDLCTGTGCIALLLERRLDEAKIDVNITAIDKSRSAVSLALLNKKLSLRSRFDDSSCARVSFEKVDIFEDDAMDRLINEYGPFDLIASNPPYVTAEEWKTLDKNVRDWEDSRALIGDVDDSQDGLAFYRRIAVLIDKRGILTPNPTSPNMPRLLVEVGHKQAKAVQDLFTATGRFSKTARIQDQWQQQRGVMAWTRPSRQ